MSKGSRPRPYSVSQATFASNYDAIFGKKNNMQVRVQEDESKVGQCGCGRSPTGKCIGWHGLTEADFQSRLASYLEDEQSKNVSDSTQGG
jgi:hypothetical protein